MTTHKRISKPSWLLLVPANCLLSTVIAAPYGYPKENHKNIAFHAYDTPVFASASASTSATSMLVPPVTATVPDDSTDNAFDSEAAGSGPMGTAKPGHFYTSGPTPTGTSYSATPDYATTGHARPTHSAVSSSSQLPSLQQVVRQVTGVEHDIGDFPRTYDNHKRLYVDFQYSDVLHMREVMDVSPDISDFSSACHDNSEQLSVNLQSLEVVQEVTDGSHDLKHLPQLHDNLEQPSVDTQDRGLSPIMGDLADAFLDIPKPPNTNTDDSRTFNESEPHQARMESTEEPDLDTDEHASPVGSIMDDAEKRRRIVLSSQSSPVINKVFGPYKGLALDFGINWLPKNWNPYNDPPMLGHIVEEWNELISEQERQNAETDINNKILQGNVQSIGITLNDFRRKMKVFRLTETRSQERDDHASERETELDARDAENAKTKQDAEALLQTAKEAVRRVKRRSLHKALREVSRDHFSQSTDSRSTAVSVPQPTPFWRAHKAQPYCPVPESPLAIRTAQAVCQLWGQTLVWLRSVDWRGVGEDMWRWAKNAGHRVSILLYHLCWFFVLYACRSKIEKSFVTPPGPPRFPGDLPDLDDLEDDRHRRQSSDSRAQQFGTPRTRRGDDGPRRRGRYGLVSRSPSPENLEVLVSRPVTPTQLIPELTSSFANGIRSVFDEQRGRLVEPAASLRRSRSVSPSMTLSGNEDMVRRTIATSSPPVPIGPASESEPEELSLHVSSTSDVVNDAIVGLLRRDLVTTSGLDTHPPSVQLDAVEVNPSAQVVPQMAAEDIEIVVTLNQQDALVATVSSGTERCDGRPPVPESSSDSIEIGLQPQPDASGETTVTNEVIKNAQILHEEVVEVSAPQQTLDNTAETFELVNDAAVSLQPELVGHSAFDTPAMQPDAGDAVTSGPPVRMLAQMATEDSEIVSPVQEEASVSTVSCNPTPCNAELPVSESAIEGVESKRALEPYVSGQTTAVIPVSNNAPVSQEKEKVAVDVFAPIQQAPPTANSAAPFDSTVDFERRAIAAPAPSMPSQQHLHTPSKQIQASVRRVAFSPEPSVIIIPRDEEEEDLATVGQAIVNPDPAVVERVAETLEAPASPMVAMETAPTLLENAPLSAAFVAEFQTALLTAMHVEDEPAAFHLSELSSVLTEIENESMVTAMDVEQQAPSPASVNPLIAPTDLVVFERVRETLEAPVLPFQSTSLVGSMETQDALMENTPQAVILAAIQTPMDVEDVMVAEAPSAISVAMDVEDESAPSLPNQLFTAPMEIEHATVVAKELDVAMQDVIVETDGVFMERDDATLEMEGALSELKLEDVTLEMEMEDATLEMEMEDATIEVEDENMGNDDKMAERSAPDVLLVHQTQIELDPGLKTPEEPGNTNSNDARPSEPTAQPSAVLQYPPFIPPVSVISGPQFLPSVTNFPVFSVQALPPASTSTSKGFSAFGISATPTSLATKSTTELIPTIPVVSKNVSKPRHPDMVKKPCSSRPINPSQPAVELEVSQGAPMQARLSDAEEMKPWEIEKARTQALVDLLEKEKSESVTSAANADIPMEPSPASILPTAPDPADPSAKPPPGMVRRVNNDGRTVFVPIQNRFKPTKPKPATASANADIPMEPSPASILHTAPDPADPSAKPPPGMVRRVNNDGRTVFVPIRDRFKPTKPKPATSAANVDIPMEPSPSSMPTAPSPANRSAKPPPANPLVKPPLGVVRRINNDGRIVFIPIRSRFQPTKPKPTEPATSLPTTCAAGAPASSDIANDKSVTASVPAPKEKTYLPWEYEKLSTKVVMEILGEQLAAEAQTYGQLYRPLGTAWPASSTAEVPVQQQVADDPEGEPMTMNENMTANVALQQAQTLGERQVRGLPPRRRRPVGPEQPSPIANQQNLEASTTNLPLNVPPPATADALPVLSNADESQIVDEDNGSMNGNARPEDLDTPTEENAVDPFSILVALSDVNAVRQTDNDAEGGSDPGYESMSDVDLEDADNLWSPEDDYPT